MGCEVHRLVVPDEREEIQEVIKRWVGLSFHLVLTAGGTGFAPRDITPEATKPLLEKECPGIVAAMLNKSLEITPMAMLSRPVAGICSRTLIINLPGSPKGATENLSAILKPLPHAIALIRQSSDKDQHS